MKSRQVGYIADKDKNDSISIVAKDNEAVEYPYISIFVQHGYRRHETRVPLTCNQGATLFADGDIPNTTATCNFWREHRLILVDPNRQRDFRLENINWQQLLALNDTMSQKKAMRLILYFLLTTH